MVAQGKRRFLKNIIIMSIVSICTLVLMTIIIYERQQHLIAGQPFSIYAIAFLLLFSFCTFLVLFFPRSNTLILSFKDEAHLSSLVKIMLYPFVLLVLISHSLFQFHSTLCLFSLWMAMLMIITKNIYLFCKKMDKIDTMNLRTTLVAMSKVLWEKTLYTTWHTLFYAFIMSILFPRYHGNIPQYQNISSYIVVWANAWGHYFLWTLACFLLCQFVAMAFGSFLYKRNHVFFGVTVLFFLSLAPTAPIWLLDHLYSSWVLPYNNYVDYEYATIIANKSRAFLYTLSVMLLCCVIVLYNLYRKNNFVEEDANDYSTSFRE
ncbi:hypothetical protein [Candidatus Uabimicrobium amorphum]|uniref:Uncharacterized protein n=1 Tax=Uabimicrobium amorphum TaxID=2596890 RepID=A0A5S9F4L0_UABAM|nr:hypothetical protein [Candidatus Uabimicrobium amorphum]BBM85896.1 hypothetical protein UABAM_04278 [Candidatus Uabimicrobium amorphum]